MLQNLVSKIHDTGEKRILIVDDEPYNCLALLTLLKSLSLKNLANRVDLCMSGKDTLNSVIHSIQNQKERPRRRSISVSPSAFVTHQGRFEFLNSEKYERLSKEIRAAVAEERPLDQKELSQVISPSSKNTCDYGLILSDCSMPFMDGYEFTKCIRLLLRSCGISSLEEQPRIVAITGHFEPEFQMKAIQCGMEKVYPKPMTKETLSQVLIESGFEIELALRDP